MYNSTRIGQRILLTLWVGGLWAVGYIVTPTLFHVLDDRQLAGMLAGRLFGIMSYLGLACGLLLLAAVLYQAGRAWRATWQIWVLLIMLGLISLGEFGLTQQMQALKAAHPQGFIQGTEAAQQFGMLHGLSSGLFLATSLLGLALVIFGLEPKRLQP